MMLMIFVFVKMLDIIITFHEFLYYYIYILSYTDIIVFLLLIYMYVDC